MLEIKHGYIFHGLVKQKVKRVCGNKTKEVLEEKRWPLRGDLATNYLATFLCTLLWLIF